MTGKGLSRRSSMYLGVVTVLEGLALQLDDLPGEELAHPDFQDRITVNDVREQLRELAADTQGASEAVHQAAHKQGGTLNFDALRDLQERCTGVIMAAHIVCFERGLPPAHDMPSFSP